MNKTIKKAWIKALRSGEYAQGSQGLRSIDDKFCCLGVLCDIALDDWWIPISPGGKYYSLEESEAVAYLPNNFSEKVRITQRDQSALAKMNDRGMSFTEIADWIEDNL